VLVVSPTLLLLTDELIVALDFSSLELVKLAG
jgi:hypothetical protein